MLTETNYKTKVTINILMASMTLLLLAIFVFNIKFECVVLKYLNIRCPACGLTRSFKAILEGKYDHLPEAAFLYVGTIEDAVKKGESL